MGYRWLRLKLVCPHIRESRRSRSGICRSRIIHPGIVIDVCCRSDRSIACINKGGACERRQVIIDRSDNVIRPVRIHEEWISVDIADAAVAALHIGIGNSG